MKARHFDLFPTVQEVKKSKLERTVNRLGTVVCLKTYQKTMMIQGMGEDRGGNAVERCVTFAIRLRDKTLDHCTVSGSRLRAEKSTILVEG